MKTIDFRYDLLPLKDKVFRLALRITLNREEAEDITQDTLLKAWERREELAGVKSTEAYVLTVCRNLSLDHIKAASHQVIGIDDNPTDAPDSSPQPDEQLEERERLERVKQIFDSLPPNPRTALQLRDIEGKSYKEIADIMGQTEANVKVLIFRARQSLKQQLKKNTV